MTLQASLREFNHQVAHYVTQAEHGAAVIITRRGQPVAELMPYLPKQQGISSAQRKIMEHSLQLLNNANPSKKFTFKRDELYDR